MDEYDYEEQDSSSSALGGILSNLINTAGSVATTQIEASNNLVPQGALPIVAYPQNYQQTGTLSSGFLLIVGIVIVGAIFLFKR